MLYYDEIIVCICIMLIPSLKGVWLKQYQIGKQMIELHLGIPLEAVALLLLDHLLVDLSQYVLLQLLSNTQIQKQR